MPKPKFEGTCALCGNEGQLCKSHILPEFLHEPCYDEKHRLKTVTSSSARFNQHGIKTPLLCLACEGKLNRHETYVADLTRQIRDDTTEAGGIIRISDFDYKAIKLFGISLLWRCAVSNLEEFDNVRLGPHEAKMHGMLLNEDPGLPEQYAMSLVKLSGSLMAGRTVSPPTPGRKEGGMMAYRMIAMGIDWELTVSKHFALGNFPEARPLYVGMSKELLVPVYQQDDATFVKRFWPSELRV